MSDGSNWGWVIGLAIVGIPTFIWGEPLSRWNRRVGRKWGWHVPEEGAPGSLRWSARWMRFVGGASLVAALVIAIFALLS